MPMNTQPLLNAHLGAKGFTLLELLIGIVLFGVLSIRSKNFNLI